MNDTIKHKRPAPVFMYSALLGKIPMPPAPIPPLFPGLSPVGAAVEKSSHPWHYPLTFDEQWLLRDSEQDKRNQERAQSWANRGKLV